MVSDAQRISTWPGSPGQEGGEPPAQAGGVKPRLSSPLVVRMRRVAVTEGWLRRPRRPLRYKPEGSGNSWLVSPRAGELGNRCSRAEAALLLSVFIEAR